MRNIFWVNLLFWTYWDTMFLGLNKGVHTVCWYQGVNIRLSFHVAKQYQAVTLARKWLNANVSLAVVCWKRMGYQVCHSICPSVTRDSHYPWSIAICQILSVHMTLNLGHSSDVWVSTLSMTSEENGRHVNMIYRCKTLIIHIGLVEYIYDR